MASHTHVPWYEAHGYWPTAIMTMGWATRSYISYKQWLASKGSHCRSLTKLCESNHGRFH